MGGQQAGARSGGAGARGPPRGERPPARLPEREREDPSRRPGRRTSTKGMGCVASAVRISGSEALVAHVGRHPRLPGRGGGLRAADARPHGGRARARSSSASRDRGAKQIGGQNQVTRDLGGQSRKGDDWVDDCEVKLEEDDLLVLCSDGCTAPWRPPASSAACARRASRPRPPMDLAEELVRSPWPAAPRTTRRWSSSAAVPGAKRDSIWKKDVLAWMKRKPELGADRSANESVKPE